MNTPTSRPLRSLAGMWAFSRASQVSSSASRCCGSTISASRGLMPKNSASKSLTSVSSSQPPRFGASARTCWTYASPAHSDQRESGRGLVASRPEASRSQVASGLSAPPGKRVARPMTATSNSMPAPRSRNVCRSVGSSASTGPLTTYSASEAMVGCW